MKNKSHYGKVLPGQSEANAKILLNKKSKELAKYGYGKVIFQISRQRDIIFIVAVCLAIALAVSLYFNVTVYWL